MEKQPPTETIKVQWRCQQCGVLLGIIQGATLSIRYKSLAYEIKVKDRAEIRALCRNCAVWRHIPLPTI